jgi:hypothetical protein
VALPLTFHLSFPLTSGCRFTGSGAVALALLGPSAENVGYVKCGLGQLRSDASGLCSAAVMRRCAAQRFCQWKRRRFVSGAQKSSQWKRRACVSDRGW